MSCQDLYKFIRNRRTLVNYIVQQFKLTYIYMADFIETAGNVKVVCRFRPLNEKQQSQEGGIIYQKLDSRTVAIKDKGQKDIGEGNKFTFDQIFEMKTTQKQVYNYAAASIVESVIEGFNGTIFAYGQTSSGKTHTMEGQVSGEITPNSGIIPRVVEDIFSFIVNSSKNLEFRIKISLVELYNEKLKDLIEPSKSELKIRSSKKRGIFIEDLTEVDIVSPEEVFEILQDGQKNRAVASTNMNERSSRSHVIFIISITQNNMEDMSAKSGKLYLVDLAGSEKMKKTGAEGKVLDEAKKINASLTALGKVINALTDGKSTHVPYRDSKLTRVLQESLGGNSKTTLIVTCSPHFNNLAETLSTLRFGISAKKIKNKPKINKEVTVAELQILLDKAEYKNKQKDDYISQLKNYIQNDLKKPLPKLQNIEKQNEQVEIMSELEKQLELQSNLRTVIEEELNQMKEKQNIIYAEKEQLENSYEEIQKELRKEQDKIRHLNKELNQKNLQEKMTPKKNSLPTEQQEKDGAALDILQKINELGLEKQTQNRLQRLIRSANGIIACTHGDLQQEYEQEKERRQKLEDKMLRDEKTIQKKTIQLENNICQLTHAYYDLICGQKKFKIDNMYLKKKVEEQDATIQILKQNIKDLEEENRELENIQNFEHENQEDYVRPTRVMRNQVTSEQEIAFHPSARKSMKMPKVVRTLKGGK